MRSSILACTAFLAVAIPLTVSASELSEKDIATARKLYVSKCAKCHRFYEPKDYSGSEWDHWMNSMSRKSKLKPEQEQLLTRYLLAYREGKIPVTH